jgi:Lamin Tail Domain
MRKIVTSLLAVIVVAAGLIAVESQQASAASYCVQIFRIYYNSPGTDTGSNTSLNAEFITLHNRCSTARPLTNWIIRDSGPNHTYTFGTYTLGAGAYVRVHTGKGTNTATDRYWGLGWYVWNNDKDAAYLRDYPNRTLIDYCSYTGPDPGWIYC